MEGLKKVVQTYTIVGRIWKMLERTHNRIKKIEKRLKNTEKMIRTIHNRALEDEAEAEEE